MLCISKIGESQVDLSVLTYTRELSGRPDNSRDEAMARAKARTSQVYLQVLR